MAFYVKIVSRDLLCTQVLLRLCYRVAAKNSFVESMAKIMLSDYHGFVKLLWDNTTQF